MLKQDESISNEESSQKSKNKKSKAEKALLNNDKDKRFFIFLYTLAIYILKLTKFEECDPEYIFWFDDEVCLKLSTFSIDFISLSKNRSLGNFEHFK